MIKFIIRIAIILIIALVGYNYFFGSAEEKESAQNIIDSFKKLWQETWSMLKSEKEKIDEGKYDEALSGLENVLSNIGDELGDNSRSMQGEVAKLEAERQELMQEAEALEDGSQNRGLTGTVDPAKEEELARKIKELYEKTENLLQNIEK